ncbi:MAG: sodium-dependent transporter [Luteitalea sp.]|nr:sodium-dependent transporter [Luteitalea sp.]
MAVSSDRGMWSGRLGFILATAGSAVGLGNIWGFPTQVGQGGGAAFVLIYLVCVFLICVPIQICEFAIGRRGQRAPVGAFDAIRPGSRWWLVGGLGVITGVGILSFYVVVAGWTLAYIWFAAVGAAGDTPKAIESFFGRFAANAPLNLFLTIVTLAMTAAIILGGVRNGIERASRALMPLLFGLLVLLAIRAVTLPGAADGLAYYLKPDFSRLTNIRVFNAALGQAFFSLSLGMGTLITYGSYLSKRESIGSSALWIAALDTTIALLAGFVIFPAGFSIPGFDPSASGPGLIFQVLPRLFATLPGGQLFGATFFLLLFMAALTSAISLLEVPVAHLIDEHRWSRRKAVLTITAATALLAVPSALSNGAVGALTQLPGLGLDFLTLMSTIWNNFSLPIGGLLTAIFVGYIWRVEGALSELLAEHAWFPYPRLWGRIVRYVCPVAIVVIILFTIRALVS